MRRIVESVVLVSIGVATGGCVANVGDEPWGEGVSEPVSSVRQALTSASVKCFDSSGTGAAIYSCPSGFSWMLGSGALAWNGINAVSYTGSLITNAVEVVSTNPSDTAYAFAVCSQAPTFYRTKFGSSGHALAECDSGMVAVGGGGVCSSSSGKLYRSRPNPDTNGSEPTAGGHRAVPEQSQPT
jgi:hypothetical protein